MKKELKVLLIKEVQVPEEMTNLWVQARTEEPPMVCITLQAIFILPDSVIDFQLEEMFSLEADNN